MATKLLLLPVTLLLFSATVQTLHAQDQTAPTVTDGPIVTPDVVDLSEGPVNVQVSVTIEDDDSGVASAFGYFISSDNAFVGTLSLSLDSGTAQSGTWLGEATISEGTADGDYALALIVADGVNNTGSQQFESVLSVSGGDVNAPELVGTPTLSPSSITVGTEDVTITATFEAVDDQSGISQIQTLFLNEEGAAVAADQARLIDGDEFEGTWESEINVSSFTLNQFVPTGDLFLSIQLVDEAQNFETFDNVATLEVVRDKAAITFQVDTRRLERTGLFTPFDFFNSSMRMYVDVSEGPEAGSYELLDFDRDSIFSAIVLLSPDQTVSYAFAIDPDGDETNLGDWVFERPGNPRTLDVTGATSLPAVPFDDEPLGQTTAGFDARVVRSFPAGASGSYDFDSEDNLTQVTLSLDELTVPSLIAVRRLARDPGGSPPSGITSISSAQYWIVATTPSASSISGDFTLDYSSHAGITDPPSLRLLSRETGGPWQSNESSANTASTTVTTSVSEVAGEWTLGSASAANPLTPQPPGLVSQPLPSDGQGNVVPTTSFSWAPADFAITYDVYLWPAEQSEPSFPIATDLTGPQMPPNFVFLERSQEYRWNVLARNLDGETRGPTWSFTTEAPSDLAIGEVSVPTEGFSGREIDLQWTVTNVGTVGTTSPVWQDIVRVSNDPSFLDDVRTIGAFGNPSALPPGEQYVQEARVTLPNDLVGTYYLRIDVNWFSGQSELTFDNNFSLSTIEIAASPTADLVVTEIVSPPNAFSGQEVQVSWTVENQGEGVALANFGWTDEVVWSPTPQYDDATAVYLGSFRREESLGSGMNYAATVTGALPEQVSGDSYFIVTTDRGDGVFERNGDANNSLTSDPVLVTLSPPPDLEPTAFNAPPSAAAGDEIQVSWEVANRGPGELQGGSWQDRIFVTGPELDRPIVLGTARRGGTMIVDTTYERSTTVRIPDGLEGAYTLTLETDWAETVFEHNFEDNNQVASGIELTRPPYPDLSVTAFSAPSSGVAGSEIQLQWTVRNEGDGSTDGGWIDRIYISAKPEFDTTAAAVASVPANQVLAPGGTYNRVSQVRIPPSNAGTHYLFVVSDADRTLFEYPDDSSNNIDQANLEVGPYPPVDLVVVNASSVDESLSGETIGVSWTVENVGEAPPTVPVWDDVLYLSADQRLDPTTDVMLARVPRSEGLVAGGSYSRTVEVRLPDGASGPFNILIKNQVVDVDTLNNIGRPENPVIARVGPRPDLVPVDITAPETAVGGQPIEVSWTVRNEGENATGNAWFDAIYLSNDQTIGLGDLLLAGERQEGAELAQGGEYVTTTDIPIPIHTNGTVFLLVVLDDRDAIFESDGEDNNVFAHELEVVAAPPSDLIVTDVTVPENAVPGQESTISWTIENQGQHPASGILRDAIYVSSDEQWQVDDPLLGSHDRFVELGPGESLSISSKVDFGEAYQADAEAEITGALPGVAPGMYRAIVRVDVRNNIRESAENNNTTVSGGQIDVDLELLPIGGLAEGDISPGQSRYYRLVVPDSIETVELILESDSENASNELHVTAGAVPTRASSEVRFQDPFAASFTMAVPNSSAEDSVYYVLLYAREGPTEGTTYSLSAREAMFELHEIDLTEGGQGGDVTVRMTGTAFGSRIYAALESDDQRIVSSNVVRTSAVEAYATFDLTGVPMGTYDFVLEQDQSIYVFEQDSLRREIIVVRSILAGGFQVVAPVVAEPSFELILPEALRTGQEFTASIEVTNRGNNDRVSPLVAFWTDPATMATLHLDEDVLPGYKRVLLSGPAPIAGILRPAATHRALIQVAGPDSAGILQVYSGPVVGSGAPFDFDTELQAAMLDVSDLMLDDAVEALRNEFQTTGWRGYQQALAETATLLSRHGLVEKDAGRLLFHLIYSIRQGRTIPSLTTDFASNISVPPDVSVGKFMSDDPCSFVGNLASDVPTPPDCSTSQLVADQTILTCIAAEMATPQVCGGTNAGELMLHFLTGDGSARVFGSDSDVAEKLRNWDDAQTSYNDVHGRVSTDLNREIADVLTEAGCQGPVPSPNGDLGDLGLSVPKPNPYPCDKCIPLYNPLNEGIPDEFVTEQPGCDLVTAFGGFQSASALLTNFRVRSLPDPTADYCEPGCTLQWDATITYEFGDQYEYDTDDAGDHRAARARNLQLCGEAQPFETKVYVKDPIGGIVRIPPGQKKCERPPPPELPPFVFPPEPIPIITSRDPNDIVGPAGYGDERWVSVSAQLPYKIRFENDPKLATAPAQTVTIEQFLPDSTLDVRSFRLGSFGFGSFRFSPPENSATYVDRIDLTDSLGILVDVNAGVDVETNRVFWILSSIDPATGTAPSNPLSGFLPVNDSTSAGEGFVSYVIRPNPDSRTGDVILAKADIVFDDNEVIETPEVFNTIDAGLPTSLVSGTPSRVDSAIFAVNWTGRDDQRGSGIEKFDLYVSKDGGPFEVYQRDLEDNSVLFNGEYNHRYNFYTLSSDRAGNLEPATGKTGVLVIVGTEDEKAEIPEEFSLGQNYPNPFNPETTVPYGLPQPADVELLVYTALGQRVVTYNIGRQRAGLHSQRVDMKMFASGVYFYEIRARDQGKVVFSDVRKLVFVK